MMIMIRRGVFLKSIVMMAITVVLLSAGTIKADITGVGIEGIAYHEQGGNLSSAPNYDWWYGCSPTSAGMMMGYYDRNGYFDLVLGGTAELSTYGAGTYIANDTIASSGHIADFYRDNDGDGDPYGDSGDDVSPPFHSFNSLADFMGTSQDGVRAGTVAPTPDNTNGSTTFWNFTDGSQLSYTTIAGWGANYMASSGMYGIYEYIVYAGYDVSTLYNQYIYGWGGNTLGFTLAQYQAEIDAGRPVMIHIEGHSMFGYGYVDGTTTINVYDTWNDLDGGGSWLDGQNPGTLTWGGTYGTTGWSHYGVTVLTVVPVPGAVLLGILGMGVVGIKLRKYA
ncbi:MAG: hypothetical protein JSV03_08210 [Planctomycetota bacterium]|nr:MAG: hypothetical protein JSV03_08210 [Planctomycetota bacterium]